MINVMVPFPSKAELERRVMSKLTQDEIANLGNARMQFGYKLLFTQRELRVKKKMVQNELERIFHLILNQRNHKLDIIDFENALYILLGSNDHDRELLCKEYTSAKYIASMLFTRR
jgi:hypothetical protein